MSPSQQTSSLESFHKVVCLFAPKFQHFFYPAMRARILLAALHFNENSDRSQAVNKAGNARWRVSYPKYKDGGIINEVKVDCTYLYIDKLMFVVEQLRSTYPSYTKAKDLLECSADNIPRFLTAAIEKEKKENLIRKFKTRFPNKQKPVQLKVE